MEARKMTPMLVQYQQIKRQYPDSVLFYRMGDFYEMFFDDAELAAPILEVQLTSRDKSSDQPIPMCGVPFHSVDGYLQKLLSAGHKVAMCEQVEDPAAAKGIVRREVVRVLTPSLVADPSSIDEASTRVLLAISRREGEMFDVAAFDLFGSSVRQGDGLTLAALQEAFRVLRPREILVEASIPSLDLQGALVSERPAYFDANAGTARRALALYLEETQKVSGLLDGRWVEPLLDSDRMRLDSTTLRCLEILDSADGSSGNTALVDVVDRASTAMGRRRLREWLARPSRSAQEIEARWDAVEELVTQVRVWEHLQSELREVRDIERLATKLLLGTAGPRDLGSIGAALAKIPAIRDCIQTLESAKLRALASELDPMPEIAAELRAAFVESLPHSWKQGGIFQDTYDPTVQELRQLAFDAKSTIAKMEADEKESTGISSLKIKFSKVFGYTIEVTNTHLSKVPAHYTRKQTIAGGERFITEDLKRFEERAMSAEQKLEKLEEGLFLALRKRVADFASVLVRNARVLSEIDALQSFARVSRERAFRRPVLSSDRTLSIVEGRHPVVETFLPPGTFVPNSLRFSPQECRTAVVTGPNMAGKSTILRQMALICVLAQAGCFVPAKQAELPILDAIFTRIGSGDDIGRGRSTFMVEMSEVARILQEATRSSLILIDEIGRGTSTYDGLALASSLLEYLHLKVQANVIFATHFHEVTELEKRYTGIRNFSVQVLKDRGQMVFLHRLSEGACDRSYGVEVAQLAGLPQRVIDRARELLGRLEAAARPKERSILVNDEQMSLFDGGMPQTLDSQGIADVAKLH